MLPPVSMKNAQPCQGHMSAGFLGYLSSFGSLYFSSIDLPHAYGKSSISPWTRGPIILSEYSFNHYLQRVDICCPLHKSFLYV